VPIVITAHRDYDVNHDNYMLLAIKCYDRPNAIMSEFAEDYKRVKYIKRQIGKFLNTGSIRTRLVLNHVIVLSNVFGADFTTRLLYLKLDKEHYPILKTFLLFLNYQPDFIRWIEGEMMVSADIPVNQAIADELRKI
jgi:hypothetical protein